MSILAANIVVLVAAAYLAVGLVFAVAFAWRGAGAIDAAAAVGGLGFRLLLIPGATLLWPWMVRKWARGDSGLPGLAPARVLRRRHLPMWVSLGPLALVGLALAVAARGPTSGGVP